MYIEGFKNNEDVASNYAGEHYGDTGPKAKDYQKILDELNASIVHAAWYGYGGYEGSSFVLYTNADGKLKEVNGSHCSCFGLEGQWRPEDTTWESLAHIIEKGQKFTGDYDGYKGKKDLNKAIIQLVQEKVGRTLVRKAEAQ
jgi:hypothetical protein